MSIVKQIAAKIPNNVRSKFIITLDDPIANAQPHSNNQDMLLLAKIWYEFIAPTEQFTTCSICLDNILKSFRQMKSELIELENEYQLLEKL